MKRDQGISKKGVNKNPEEGQVPVGARAVLTSIGESIVFTLTLGA